MFTLVVRTICLTYELPVAAKAHIAKLREWQTPFIKSPGACSHCRGFCLGMVRLVRIDASLVSGRHCFLAQDLGGLLISVINDMRCNGRPMQRVSRLESCHSP